MRVSHCDAGWSCDRFVSSSSAFERRRQPRYHDPEGAFRATHASRWPGLVGIRNVSGCNVFRHRVSHVQREGLAGRWGLRGLGPGGGRTKRSCCKSFGGEKGLIPGGQSVSPLIFGSSLVATVLVAKYGDFCPFFRLDRLISTAPAITYDFRCSMA